jgi:1-aminocyclopropane-1-carboxylate deaminase/D-cysteine desulfhydrase-like pyridoxal-dependent ACC family enzyme
MAALMSMLRTGDLEARSGEAIVFLHTRGTPGLFAYRDALSAG